MVACAKVIQIIEQDLEQARRAAHPARLTDAQRRREHAERVQWQQLSEKKRAKVLRWRENVARIEALNAATVRKAERDEIVREQMLGRVPCVHVESEAVFAARAADNESRVHLLEALQVCLFPKHVNLCKYGSSVSNACTSGPPGVLVSDICVCTRETSIHVSDIRAPLALQVYMCLIYVYYLDGQTCQICPNATRGRLVRQHIRRQV